MVERITRQIPLSQLNLPKVFEEKFEEIKMKELLVEFITSIIQKKNSISGYTYLGNDSLSTQINERFRIKTSPTDIQKLFRNNNLLFEQHGIDLAERTRYLRKSRSSQRVHEQVPTQAVARAHSGVIGTAIVEANERGKRKVGPSFRPSATAPELRGKERDD